jgi:hypothetical protein
LFADKVVNAPVLAVDEPTGVFCKPLVAEVIVPPTFKFSLIPTPPVTCTCPVVVLVLVVLPVNVTVLLAPSVVNAPVPLVMPPIFVLLILPVVPGLILTVPVPVGLIVTAAFAGLKPTAALAFNVVNAPAPLVVPPIATLSIVPAVAGLTVTVPVPVGLAVTLAFAGLNDTELFAVNAPLNVPVVAETGPPSLLEITYAVPLEVKEYVAPLGIVWVCADVKPLPVIFLPTGAEIVILPPVLL